MSEAVLNQAPRNSFRSLEKEIGLYGCMPVGADEGDECRVCDASNRPEEFQED